jgi:hypothetical protein
MTKPTTRTALAIGAAVLAGSVAAATTGAQAQAPAAKPAAETPRTPDGHPDLGGVWVGGGVSLATGAEEINLCGRGGFFVGFEADGAVRRTTNDNVPVYKPQYWDQVTDNDYLGNWEDPVSHCISLGVPRQGGPHQIINIAGQPAIILVNQAGFNGYNGTYQSHDVFRIVYTDNRPRDPKYVAYESMMGAPQAHWDGDTLVIESIGFTDATWLHKNGYIHGFNMKVTERLTRKGDFLIWEATVEDPDYLTEPWVMTPMIRQINKDPNAYLPEALPCLEREPYGSPTRSG